MSPLRIAAIVLVIGAGLTGAYLIIKNSIPVIGSREKFGNGDIEQSLVKSPIQWINKIGSSIAEIVKNDAENASNSVSQISKTGSQPQINFTEAVAKSLFDQMKSRDQGGGKPFTNFDPNDPDAQRLISEATKNFYIENVFNQTVPDKDIKISEDNSKTNKIKYLENIGQASRVRMSDPKYQRSGDQIIADISNDCFGGGAGSLNRDLAGVYKNLTNDYLNIPAPSDWALLHKQIVSHFKNSEAIYQSFADCVGDPVRSYLATQALPGLVDRATSIQSLLNEKYKEIQ